MEMDFCIMPLPHHFSHTSHKNCMRYCYFTATAESDAALSCSALYIVTDGQDEGRYYQQIYNLDL